MADALKYDVFLSYSSKDRLIVREIAERLRGDGIQVWFDQWEILPGDSIPAKIEEGLENSRVLVLCMSANSFGSDWTQMESGTFRFRDPLNKERRFVPVRLDQAQIKNSLQQFLYVDWETDSRDQEYPKLLAACGRPSERSETKARAEEQLIDQESISLGHTSTVRSAVFSSDGTLALSGSFDNTVRLWDVKSGRCLRVLEGHTNAVSCVSWSSDDKLALSGSDDNTVRLWDVQSGRCLRVIEGHSDPVFCVAWSRDGKFALSGSLDESLRLWSVDSGRCVRVLEGHTDTVFSVVWSSDDKLALSGSIDDTMRLWDVESGRCLRVFEGHTAGVFSVAWSSDDKLALSGSDDTTVRLWDVQSGRCLNVFEGHTNSVLSVSRSSDDKRALSASSDNTVRLWDVQSGRCLGVLEGHTESVWSVSWSNDDKIAVSGSEDNTIRLWDLRSGRCVRVFEGHTNAVRSVAWNSDDKFALSGSLDNTVRLWDAQTGHYLSVLEGHTARVLSVAWSNNDKFALSGSADHTLRLWNVKSGRCLRVLEAHTDTVFSVAWSNDDKLALSGSLDDAVRVWDVQSGRCLGVLEGHTGDVCSVSWSNDDKLALSGSADETVRVWDVQSGRCLTVLDGHTESVWSVSWSSDNKLALSGSSDNTVRLWDVQSGRCLRVLEGHSDSVMSVAWSSDDKFVLSGSADNTVRLWDVHSGRCLRVLEGHTAKIVSVAWSSDDKLGFSSAINGVTRVWKLADTIARIDTTDAALTQTQIEYTNAKVLLVGDPSSGKTCLTQRLATSKWKPSDGSTVGGWCTQWQIIDSIQTENVEREIWLWDFGGQADQRLVNLLYMDRAALVLLLFDADKEDVIPGLREWVTALRRCVTQETPLVLVAGRIDAGFRASRMKLQTFAEELGVRYLETSAKDGTNCIALEQEIKTRIPWDNLTKRTSPRIFKLIKDELLRLRDSGQALLTFKELRYRIIERLPKDISLTDEILNTVIGLLDGPGVVKELEYGTYVLLRPEWINVYAQAVIRTLRLRPLELGALPLRSIEEGKLSFQTIDRDGSIVDEKRLSKEDERVVLREMEKQLEQRGLCLRQGDKLVFPSHCGRERPEQLEHPSVFVSYVVKGYLDDLYATLVVKLADCQAFTLKELWRDAADFETLTGDHHIGIKLTRAAANTGEINIYFAPGVTKEQQVIFANYIDSHLRDKGEKAPRMRHYICPHCGTPKGNPEILMRKLRAKKKEAFVECDFCEKRFALWDDLEILFASDEVQKQVEGLKALDAIRLDSRRKGKLLALEVLSRITSADQKCFEIPGTEDEGIDIELEFTDEEGKGTGKRLYLQLKSGNSHLEKRKDGVEIFRVKKQRWVKYWMRQPHPVMLVIGTFTEEKERLGHKEKLEFDEVRWMEISDYIKRESDNGTRPVKQIEFKGERLDMTSVRRVRDLFLRQ